MCRECWYEVPHELRQEVNRTVGLRAPSVDETWAPWWRAQAKAIAHVAYLREPDEAVRDRYIARAMTFAAGLKAATEGRDIVEHKEEKP